MDEQTIVAIRTKRAAGIRVQDIANEFNVSIGFVSRLARGLVYPDSGGPIVDKKKALPKTEYGAWRSMMRRCYDEKHKHFSYYGGRTPPITVCDEWRDNPRAFIEYMGRRPPHCNGGLDRINTNGNYEPGNVRWSTRTQQMRNRRNNIYVTYHDRQMLLQELVEESGHTYNTLYRRLFRYGWSADRAADTPSKHSDRGTEK